MNQSERDQIMWTKLNNWEEKLQSYAPNDFELTADKYIERIFSLLPSEVQQKFFQSLDTWLFHLHALIQGSQFQVDAKERILVAGRVFDPSLEQISDLRRLSIDQLQYIADQQISRHRLYSFVQGGLTGTGHATFLGVDIPAITVINLRVVQLLASVYGYNVNTPFEMMTSLKIFHAATLPVRMHKTVWEDLKTEWQTREDEYFYEGDEDLTDTTWLQQPLQQLAKALTILFLKNKTWQGMPLLSMAIGSSANYHLTRKVTDFAQHYYQLRYMIEKEKNNE